MAKVLKIEDDIVYVGTDNGGLEEYYIGNFNYTPEVGDEVKVYDGKETIMIVKDDHKFDAQDVKNAAEFAAKNIQGELEGKVRVNKIAYALFAILLGDLGVHHFYAKKIALGVVCVLFCWTGIPAVIGLIRGIIALTQKEDEEGCIYV